MLLPNFKSIDISVQEKKRQLIFQMAAILEFGSKRFWLFLIYKSPRCFLASFKSVGLLFQEKRKKKEFQNGRRGGHLGFRIGTSLAIFDSQVTPMLPTKFQVNWPFGSGEEAKNIFFQMAAMVASLDFGSELF